MKKIVFVAHGLGNGGAERVASILASGLSKRGNEVLYLSVYNDNITYELDKNVQYHYLNVDSDNKIIKYIKRSKEIYKIINEYEPDVVISFITQEMLWTTLKGNYKLVFSERTNPAAKPLRLRVVTRCVYNKAYRVVFQTYGARDYFSDKIAKKSVIIGNPMSMDLPYWDVDNHEKTIVTACRISPEKNLKMLIIAFSKFYKTHNDYCLKIYGKPRCVSDMEELVKLSNELGISRNVLFAGYSMDIHNIIAKSSVFVLTSNYEGLSNSMLEAMCIGIPTICTDCPSGGASMFIQDGENGFLVPVNDDETLYNKLSVLVGNKELQKNISSNAVKIRKILDDDSIIDKWIDIL